jgi:hypothetical protein
MRLAADSDAFGDEFFEPADVRTSSYCHMRIYLQEIIFALPAEDYRLDGLNV